MSVLITGVTGILGSALKKKYPDAIGTSRKKCPLGCNDFYYDGVTLAYLTAGTKGFHACDGNDQAFRSDVDGNIFLIKALVNNGAHIVFISTEAVERLGHRAAYSSNRLLVEQFMWSVDKHCAIIRPRRFDKKNVSGLVDLCMQIGELRNIGVHYWP